MSLDVTALSIRVTSEGISLATDQLNKLATASSNVEKRAGGVSASTKALEASQRASVAAIDKLLEKLTRQADLLGATKSQTAAYDAAMKAATRSEYDRAKSLGAEVDAFNRKAIAQKRDTEMNNLAARELARNQSEALRMNKALDAENKSIMRNSLAEIKRKEALAYRELAAAQAEALRMNKALNASNLSNALRTQNRDIQAFNISARQYSQSHAEAIRMNNNFDRAARGAASGTRAHNEAMREAHALARGLSGSLGALWLTYGNIAGMAVGVAIGASLKGIVTVGKDVEHTLESIRVKGGETIDTVNRMRAATYDLGEGIYGPREVAKAFEILTLAGLKAEQSLLAVKAALNLAVAGGTSIQTAATALVTIGTAVGATADQYDYLGDVITKTSNISLASVESVAASMKRASVVNKLYGATFEDIAIQVAALAQLGIKDSAAGTAITNFYTNSVGGTEKAKNALKELGMEFTDAAGRAKPLIEAFEEFSQKLNTKDLKSQKSFIEDIFGERAKRDVIGIMDLVKTAANNTEKYGNRLREIQGEIAEAAGTAALAAIQISLTTENQLKSVANTLQVSFSKAFTAIEPDLNVVAMKLKQAFGSPEFVSGVSAIANAVAGLTVFLVENHKVLLLIIDAFVMWKAVTIGAALFTAISVGLTGIAASLGLVTVATTGAITSVGLLSTALRMIPGVGIILTGLTVGMALFNLTASKTKDHAVEVATAYNTNYLGALKEEAERLEKTNELIKGGQPLREAELNTTKELALEKARLNNQAAIASAQEEYNTTKKEGGWRSQAAAMAKLDAAISSSMKFEKDAVVLAGRVIQASADKKKAYEAEQQAAINAAKAAAGTGTRVVEDRRGDNDNLRKEIRVFQDEITAAKRQAEAEKANAQSAYKQGLIGNLVLIERTRDAEVNRQATIAENAVKQIEVFSKVANKQGEIQAAEGVIEAAMEATRVANTVAENARAEFSVKLTHDRNKAKVEGYLAEGQFVNAFLAGAGAKYDLYLDQLNNDYFNAADAAEAFGIAATIASVNAAKAAGLQNAEFKEATKVFEALNAEMSNVFKAVKAATDEGDLVAMWNGAMAAQQAYIDNLGKLKAAQAVVANLAATPAQRTVAQEEITKILSQGVHLKTTFKDVGASIANSLEKAFGKGGKALGEMAKVALNYQIKDNHSTKEKMDMYGDLASAASGFFDTQSNGYKKLQAVSQAFHAYELAATLTDNVAKGISAVLNQALGDPYTAFARMAAMAAIVAGLGIAISGGGSNGSQAPARQAASGAGSVLGDDTAKSDSIAKSLSILEKNSGLGLAHSNSMVGYLKTVADNISTLASLVVRTTGITSGKVDGVTEGTPSFFKTLFGSTKTSIKDQGLASSATSLADVRAGQFSLKQYADIETSKWWGMSKKTTTQLKDVSAELNTQFSLVVSSLASSVEAAANSLGMAGSGFADRLNSFQIEIEAISAKGLTGEEFEKQLSTVFSKLGDQMAEFGVAGLSQFQKVGEGYFETLARVANDLIQVKDVFAVMGQAFTATGLDAVKVAESLITAAGGLEALTTGTKFFVDNFLTEDERMAPITASVVARLGELGQSELTTIELYKNKVMALDLTNAADHALYVALLELAPAFKTAAEYAEKTVDSNEVLNKQHELDLRLMEATGKTVEATAIRRQDEIDALTKLNPKLGETQAAIYAALDAEDARKKALTEVEAVIKKNNDLYGAQRDKLKELYKAMMPVEVQRQMELDGMDARQKQMQIGIWAMEKYIKAQADLNALNKSLQDEVDKLVKASLPLAEQRKMELIGLDETSKALKLRIFFLQDEAANALKLIEIAKQQRSLDIQLMEALGNASGALAAKRLDELAAMDESLRPTQLAIYAALDAADAQEKYATKLADAKSVLQAAYDAEAGALQSTIDKFKAFSETLKKFRDDLIMGPLSTLSPEQKYLESKRRFESTSAQADLGDANAIGTLQQVSQEFLDASRGYNASTEAYARDFEAVQRGLVQGINASDQQVAAAQAQLAILNAQVGHLIEIKGAVLSVRDALAAYNAVKNGAPAAVIPGASSNPGGVTGSAYGEVQWNAYMASVRLGAPSATETSGHGVTKDVFLGNLFNVDGSHAGGLDYVPNDNYVANLHKGERVQTAARASAQDEGMQELVRISKEQYQRLCELEEHMAASNVQRAAVAEMSEEQMEAQTRKLDDIKRAVKQV